MATQWPLVKNRLITVLAGLPGLSTSTVFNGMPVTGDDPTMYATVGYVPGGIDDNAGTFSTTQDPSGFQYQETGEVRTQLVAQSGNDLATAETAAFAVADALDAVIRADRTLGGVLAPDSTLDLIVEVLTPANAQGFAAGLVLTVRYLTVT